MTEKNKQIVRDFIEEVWNQGKVEEIERFIDPEYVGHDHDSGHIVKGQKGVQMSVISVRTAFPDVMITIDDIFAENDKVVTRFTMVATPNADYSEEATENPKTMREIIIHRIAVGKIVEAWSVGTPLK